MRIVPSVILSLLASPAFAQAAPADAGGSLISMVPLVAVFAVFFFLVIRPQMKQAKERQTTINALQKGDVVVTGGGAIGKITKLGDDHLHVEIAPGVEAKFLRSTIVGLYTKPEAVKIVTPHKKNPAVKNDNLGVSKSKVANDN